MAESKSKSKSKEVTVKEETGLQVPGSFGVKGFAGFDEEDIVMPSVRLVQAMSKEVGLADGGNAEQGTFYHKGKKEAYKDLEVVIFFSKKSMKTDEKTGKDYAEARVLMAPVKDLGSPFVMFFNKYGYWNGWRPFFNTVINQKLETPWLKTVKIAVIAEKNDKGSWFEPRLTFGKDTTAKQREVAEAVYEKFGVGGYEMANEEEDPSVPSGGEDITNSEVPF